MKNNFVITTFLIGNLIFSISVNANVFYPETILENKNDFNKKNIINDISNYLFKKGLDADISIAKVNSINYSEDELNSYLIKLTRNIESLKYNDIISYIGDRALKSKELDLTSYSGVLNICHSKIGFNIPDDCKEQINSYLKEIN